MRLTWSPAAAATAVGAHESHSYMVANPIVTVELPDETYQARAVVVEGDERDRLYRAHADRMPNFDEYQAKTSRRIPVIALERL